MTFTDMHHQSSPLLLANIWDAASAQAAQDTGFSAPGTSSAAIAAMYGYRDFDGQHCPYYSTVQTQRYFRPHSHKPLIRSAFQ